MRVFFMPLAEASGNFFCVVGGDTDKGKYMGLASFETPMNYRCALANGLKEDYSFLIRLCQDLRTLTGLASPKPIRSGKTC
jgi:hypothetical protein